MRTLRTAALAVILSAAIAPISALAAEPAGESDVMLVLDVSNSMWGQIDGDSKIEIARNVIGELLQEWDPAANLGLVAYGHRREGDCSDIETVVPVGPLDAASFMDFVNGLVPRGKTPLTAAVEQAALALSYADRPATVILVSDGIETCNADPCALAAELERTGVAFTAHVIGFDIDDPAQQAQLSCIAENTGGLFLSASNAEELASALSNVRESLPLPPDDTLIALEAVDAATGLIIEQGVAWTVVDLAAETNVLSDALEARPELLLDDGDYVAIARTDTAQGQVAFSVTLGDDAVYRVRLEALLPDASVAVESTAISAGSAFPVTWEGPDADRDYITIVPAGAEEGEHGNYTYTRDGSPLALRAPDEPGSYEVRYVYGQGGVTLASVAVEILPVQASLDAVDVAVAGADIQVTWTGPDNRGDYITIVPAGAEEGAYDNYTRTSQGSPLTVLAPDEVGAFEIRYVSDQSDTTLASRPLTLEAALVTLEAEGTAVAGADIRVTWTGPDNRGDYITIVPAGAEEGAYDNYTRTSQGSPLTVLAPDEVGAFEIRYVSDQSDTTLASRPLTLEAALVTLEAEGTAVAGADIRVTWTGPDNRGDYITIVPAGAEEGAYDNYTRTSQGSPLNVRAPDEAGAFEIRYISDQSRSTLASRPLTLEAASVTLEAEGTAVAGANIRVTWTGPDNQGDYITIVPAGAEEGAYDNYTRTSQGSPLNVRAPDEAGAFEIRYISDQSRATLASLPLTLEAASVTLEAEGTAVAGANIRVTWTGPDNQGDYITIVPAGAEEGAYDNYTRTSQGNPLNVRAPDVAGAFEIRYISDQSRATLASLPLTLEAATATLDAVDSAVAGADIRVTWTGPDNQGDYITIVPAGAEEGAYDNYTRTSQGNPLNVRAPDVAGAFEIRYISDQSRTTVARRPLTLEAPIVTLEAAATAVAGTDVIITWTGPDNQGDYITIVPAGADEGAYTDYARTREGNPLSVEAPEEAGDYEIRYISDQSRRTLASLPLVLTEK